MSIELPFRTRADIRSAADEIDDRSGTRAAERFQGRVARTLRLLESFPAAGGLVDPPFPNLRVYPVVRQPHHLVYYVPTLTGIRVARVVHSSRDIDAIFG